MLSVNNAMSTVKAKAGIISGLFIPLVERWEAVHAGWITNLPVSEEGYDQILVVVDRVTKFAYLIPAKETDTAEDTVSRLFQVVFCVHGPPRMLLFRTETEGLRRRFFKS